MPCIMQLFCERTCRWAGCSCSVPIWRPSPHLGAERSGASTGVLAANFETPHGKMEFVFGKGQSMPKSWSQSIAIRIYNMCPFWLGPLECRIGPLLHCISLRRTGITCHQKHLANTSQPVFMFQQRHRYHRKHKCRSTLLKLQHLYHVPLGNDKIWPWDM